MTVMPGLRGVYDAWNRLVEARNASNVLIAIYAYNGLNQRVRKTVGTVVTTSFFNRAWQELEAVTGAQTTVNIWGLRYIDDLVLRDRGAERLYSLTDPNWNVIATTNALGTVQERMRYDAFGRVTWLNASFGVKQNTDFAWNRLFTGQVFDSESGLTLYRNRFYHTGLGRFISRDPIDYAGHDVNIYRYVRNMAMNAVDSLGQEPGCCGLEVGPHLRIGLRKLQRAFNALSLSNQRAVCRSMVHGAGWDITQFFMAGGANSRNSPPKSDFDGNGCGGGKCAGSISIGGNCFWAAEANFLLWGFARNMCEKFYDDPNDPNGRYFNNTLGMVAGWRMQHVLRIFESSDKMTDRRSPGMGIDGRLAWTLAGTFNDFSWAEDTNINERCSPCVDDEGNAKMYTETLSFYIGRNENGRGQTPTGRQISVTVTSADFPPGWLPLASVSE